ncbi:MAG: tRNA uridine-5-carboxymethylaminomethyl(34) synthesis GTPase MnmE [Verrucomicrobia bacterium]|nr:tRNA uridine-5-carboxymethylaminomethyl(34) synthesis GTPase MnmE [Verrucomicrobiota bacterium]
MPRPADTIAALATPAGTSALALIRISGSNTEAALGGLAGGLPPVRRARHAEYRGTDGVLIDDVVCVRYAGPGSYTGEDAAELSCHGNPLIAQKIVEDLFRRGCRPAEPGEFTLRAFLNGRMDLSQAEAVMEVIHARSDRALAAAHRQLRGALGRRMQTLVDELLHTLAQIEAQIDFPEEDLPPEDRNDIRRSVSHIQLMTNSLLANSHYSQLLRDGVRVVILGAPNAGKSSLLNRLVGRDRALVSPEPGTTRDFIEERVLFGPHCFRLIDTAGFNPTPGSIEAQGIAKTVECALEADILLVVVDATHPTLPCFPAELIARLGVTPTLVVINKSDLSPAVAVSVGFPTPPPLRVSALTGEGVEALRAGLVALVDQSSVDVENVVTINARHANALTEAHTCLTSSLQKLESGEPLELVASDLRGVMAAFGEITGRIDNERMLDQLFRSFCIGK